MIKIKQTVIVEGKYDKMKLSSIIDANIIATDGFRIYNNAEKQMLIKKLAEKTGIVILTDSDNAGRKIRGFLKGCIDAKNAVNIYIPKITGKERRKSEPSKENLLGVEGIDADLLRGLFKKFGVVEISEADENSESSADFDKRERTGGITKLDFYEDKLSGNPNSAANRKALCKKLELPCMAANSLLEAVNMLVTYSEYKEIIDELNLP